MKLIYSFLVDALLQLRSVLKFHSWNPSPITNWLPVALEAN